MRRLLRLEVYTMHQVVREYLLNRLSDEERERLHLWAADFYARPFVEGAKEWVKAAGEMLPEEAIAALARDRKGVLGQMVQRTDDIAAVQAAMAWALEWHHHLFQARRYEEADQIVHAIYDVLARWGRRDAAKGLLRMSIETLEGPNRAVAQGNLASLLADEGKLDEALAIHEETYRTFEAEGDKKNMAVALEQMARVYMDKGEYGKAIENYEKVFSISREIGDEEDQAVSLHQLSILYMLKGDEAFRKGQQKDADRFYKRALHLNREVEKLGRRLNREEYISRSLYQQGLTLMRLNHPTKAWECFQESLKICERLNWQEGKANALTAMGKLLMAAGRLEEAIAVFKEALEIDQQLGLWPKVTVDLEMLGFVHECQGQYAEALEKYEQALRLARQVNPTQVPTLEAHIERMRKKMQPFG